jgi:hypothetical protein
VTVITEANGDGVHVKVGDGSMTEPTIIVGVGVVEEDGSMTEPTIIVGVGVGEEDGGI